MKRLYFVCMGNYYRSRLAEELAIYYAELHGIEIKTASGGLSQIPNPHHPGVMAQETINYLQKKKIPPRTMHKYPQACDPDLIYNSDIVIFTDAQEQQAIFERRFPFYVSEIIGWEAHDKEYDPTLSSTQLIDLKVEQLIKTLKLQS